MSISSEPIGIGRVFRDISKQPNHLPISEDKTPLQMDSLKAYIRELGPLDSKKAFLTRMDGYEYKMLNPSHKIPSRIDVQLLFDDEIPVVEGLLRQVKGNEKNTSSKREFAQHYIAEHLFTVDSQLSTYMGNDYIHEQRQRILNALNDLPPITLVNIIVQLETLGRSKKLEMMSFNGIGATPLRETMPLFKTVRTKQIYSEKEKRLIPNIQLKSPPEPNRNVKYSQYKANKNSPRYFIEQSPISFGGVSRVFKAWDFKLQKAICLKELKPDNDKYVSLDDTETELEAKSIARIAHHKNLPIIYDFIEQDGKKFMVMEYVEGESVLNRIEDVINPLSKDEVLHIVGEVGNLIDDLAAHTPPLYHRDIKPSNIVIDNEKVTAIDFGIANWVDNSDIYDDSFVGCPISPGLSSPEQIYKATDPDLRSEVFNLAATSYAMIAKNFPFQGFDSNDVISATLRGQFEHLTPKMDTTFPLGETKIKSLNTVFEKAFQIKPEDRYQNAREFYDAFSAALNTGETQKAV